MNPDRNPALSRPILCYVTDGKTLGEAVLPGLRDKIRAAAEAGVDWIQIREKHMPGRELLSLTRDAVHATTPKETKTRVLINDRLDVAITGGADGLHLGGESIPAPDAIRWCRRGNAPPEFMIGVSCHDLQQALDAENAGASYIFFGPVYDTPSKRGFGPPQGIGRLAEVCRALHIPVLAIGGVQDENAAEPIKAGASGIAAIRLFQEPLRPLKESVAHLHHIPLE